MSGEITTSQFMAAWQKLFEELYNGPQDYHSTWVTTNEPDASLQGLLKRVSSEQASQVLPSRQGIAMHAEHLRWSLALANSYFRDENPQPNWEESWSVLTVDASQWDKLRADLKTESACCKRPSRRARIGRTTSFLPAPSLSCPTRRITWAPSCR